MVKPKKLPILLPPRFDGLDGARVDAFERLVAKFTISAGYRPADLLLAHWSRILLETGNYAELESKTAILAKDTLTATRSAPTRRPDPTRR